MLRGVGTLAAVRGRGYGRAVVVFHCALGFADAGEPSVAAWRDTHRLMHRLVEADAGRAVSAA